MNLKNIPNILSIIRICLVGVFVALFFTGNEIAALIVFLTAGATDVIDGYLARKNNWITNLGKILDPVADKLILPEPCANSNPSWFGFLITCEKGVDREKVVSYIESHGVQTRMLFAGNLTKHPCFDEMRATGEGYRIVGGLDNTDRVMSDTFWVGVYPGMTDEMLDYMAKTIIEATKIAEE